MQLAVSRVFQVRFMVFFFRCAKCIQTDQSVLTFGSADAPVVHFFTGRIDLRGGEYPTPQLAAVHAFDGKALLVAGEIERVKAVYQKHVAVLQGAGKW